MEPVGAKLEGRIHFNGDRSMNTLMATTPELAIYRALNKLGYYEGTDFTFQSKLLGGRDVKGGAIADFEIYNPHIVIRCQGEYWHYGQSSVVAKDELQKLAIESSGIPVIDIDAEDALRNANYYVKEALDLISHSRES
jgi:hypothetical protein